MTAEIWVQVSASPLFAAAAVPAAFGGAIAGFGLWLVLLGFRGKAVVKKAAAFKGVGGASASGGLLTAERCLKRCS